jgi:Cys-tRNA(Pro)/Cys-tRNA(Cys) deacylase
MKTNNVTRLLDAKGIRYTAYELTDDKRGAAETARLLGVPPDEVFKTIVLTREGRGKLLLAVVPGSLEVDLKASARAVGEKKLNLPTEREAEALTGLQAGGISPLALLHRGFQVLIDETALLFDEIHVSGGERSLNIRLSPTDLAAVTGAEFAQLT